MPIKLSAESAPDAKAALVFVRSYLFEIDHHTSSNDDFCAKVGLWCAALLKIFSSAAHASGGRISVDIII